MSKLFQSLLLCTALLPLIACEAGTTPEKYQAGSGKDYEILSTPVRTADPDRIEVAEAFWYGCSHCYHFEPTLEPWVAALPKDVYFVGVPVVFDDNVRILHSKMYFTARQLKLLDKLHSEIYTAMNVRGEHFDNENQIAEFFAAHGVDNATFMKTFKSFAVDSLAKQADAKVRGYGVTGTPTLIINGKYKIMGEPQKMIDVANFLITKERKAKK